MLNIKNITRLAVMCVVLMSCHSSTQSNLAIPAKRDTVPAKVKPFSGMVFASKKDIACGMPLSAGITDTAHYKGNVYAFCSVECKADFLKHPKQYLPKKQ